LIGITIHRNTNLLPVIKKSFIIFLSLTAATLTAHSANTLAVLEIIPKSEIEDISITEMRHLTDELRKQAVLALPSEGYSVLTRDNMLALMPPDEEEADCLAESCAVEIGRAIGAEYISQGSLGWFGDELSVSIELYETMSGKLLGSIVMESPDIKGLLIAIREQSPALFARIKTTASLKIENQKLDDLPKLDSLPLPAPNSPLPISLPAKKSNTPTWIAISLEALGVAALGFGIYQHIQKKKLYDKYEKMDEGLYRKEYNSALKKVNDAQDFRDAGFVAGGVLLGTGIVVHVWF